MTNQKKTKKSFLGLVLRGLGMGAADVVPGVSGGTIAFITGIYEEFLETISNLKFGLFKTWKSQGFKAMWAEMNGNFLVAIFLGIGISILSLAKLLTHLLENHPILLWSFFFGLIIASIWLVGKTVSKWNVQTILALIIGTVVAFGVTLISPSAESSNLFYIFICGSLAICAMILPGISGSFILLLLGAYTTILGSLTGMMDAVKDKAWDVFAGHFTIIGLFMAGCIFGLIAFSKVLNFAFKNFKNVTIALLTGFLIGSLNKIWPWKNTLEWRTDRHGELVPKIQENVLPNNFTEITSEPNHLLYSILLSVSGVLLIVLLERFGAKNAD